MSKSVLSYFIEQKIKEIGLPLLVLIVAPILGFSVFFFSRVLIQFLNDLDFGSILIVFLPSLILGLFTLGILGFIYKWLSNNLAIARTRARFGDVFLKKAFTLESTKDICFGHTCSTDRKLCVEVEGKFHGYCFNHAIALNWVPNKKTLKKLKWKRPSDSRDSDKQ